MPSKKICDLSMKEIYDLLSDINLYTSKVVVRKHQVYINDKIFNYVEDVYSYLAKTY